MLFLTPIRTFKLPNRIYPNLTQSLLPFIPVCFRRTHTSASEPSLKPLNYKLSNYMRNGQVEEARKMFNEMPQRNTVTWNAMIRGYCQNKQLDSALCLFRQMPNRDLYTYNTLISGFMGCGNLSDAEEIFRGMECRDVVTWNSMVSGYIRNGLVDNGIRLFNIMPAKDVVSWNLVIGGLADCGRLDMAKKLFDQMGTRDIVSWMIMISGLVDEGRLVEARQLFEQMPVKDTRAWNKVILGYVENGDIEDAEILFKNMPDRDLNSWKILIDGLVGNKRINDALYLFFEMPRKCQKSWNKILLEIIKDGFVQAAHAVVEKNPHGNIVSFTNLIVGYFAKGDILAATRIFEEMSIRDTAVWNATIFGLAENGHGEEGLKLYLKLREAALPYPDDLTFTSVLKICYDLSSLDLGEQSHAQVLKMGFNHFIAVSNAILTMYSRCGNMRSALLEFTSMAGHDVISWNSIICGFAHQGNGEKALEMFQRLISSDAQPNHITFVGVLSACGYSGLVIQGTFYFHLMRSKYHIKPTSEHYTCVIDMLGRHGLLREAMAFVDQMREDGLEIQASIWGALFGACRMFKNIDIGQIAGEKVIEMDPNNSGFYLMLAEMYMDHGRVGEAKQILVRMKERGVKKQPGCSWIDVNNCWHVFLAGDSGHYQFGSISSVLSLLYSEIEILATTGRLYPDTEYFSH